MPGIFESAVLSQVQGGMRSLGWGSVPKDGDEAEKKTPAVLAVVTVLGKL